MPINVIRRTPDERESTGRQFSNAIIGGLGQVSEFVQKRNAQKLMAQENERAKHQFGIDLTGVTDPETRRALMVQGLKGEQKRKSIQDQFNQIDQEFGQNPENSTQQTQPRQSPQQNNMPSEGEITPEQDEIQTNKTSPSKFLFPAAKIAKVGISNPRAADAMQKHNDTVLAQQKHDEDLDFRKRTEGHKEVTASYNENKEYINKTYDQYEDSLRRESILERMDQLNNSGELSDSGIVNLLEQIGLNQEWLKNPANEEYTKLALDLLGGGTLQADYGSRVLASEFKVSQQRIPSLMQTPEGRKQIGENIKAMLLPAKLKQDRMQYYLDKSKRTGEPLPHDLRGQILKDIKPQLESAYDSFQQRNGRYKVAKGTEVDDNAIEKYYYLADGNEEKARKLMQEDGYDLD